MIGSKTSAAGVAEAQVEPGQLEHRRGGREVVLPEMVDRHRACLLPEVADWVQGVRIFHVPVGPPEFVRKEDMFPFMERFTEYVARVCRRSRQPYELIHANGRADRVMWDASKLPFLWFYGEFGATKEHPYRDRFYTLALQPLSRNPYPRSTTIG